jgi:hypothetical protein
MGFLHSLTGSPPALAIEHCQTASRIAGEAGFDELDGFIASGLAQAHVVAGEPLAAIEAGERAVVIFEAGQNGWWAGRTLGHLAAAAVILGEWDRSIEYARRALEYGTQLQDLRLTAIGWYRMGNAYIQGGDVEQGLRCCDEALALSPTPYDIALAKAYRGYGEIRRGDSEAGVARLADAVAWLEGARQRYTQARFALWLAEAYLRRSDKASAASLILPVLAVSRQTGYRYLEGLACWLMAEILSMEDPAAIDFADTAIQVLQVVGARSDLARAMVTRAARSQAAGDGDHAHQLLSSALETFQLLGLFDEASRIRELLR